MPWANRNSRTRGAYHILFRSVEVHRYRYSLLHLRPRENRILFHTFFVHFKYHSSFFLPDPSSSSTHTGWAADTLFLDSNLLCKLVMQNERQIDVSDSVSLCVSVARLDSARFHQILFPFQS